jgi:hypothetical protein
MAISSFSFRRRRIFRKGNGAVFKIEGAAQASPVVSPPAGLSPVHGWLYL